MHAGESGDDARRRKRRRQQHFHRARLLLAHYCHAAHHHAHEHKEQPHYARHEVVLALLLWVIEHPRYRYNAHLDITWIYDSILLPYGGEHLHDVLQAYCGLVRLRSVNEQLHFGRAFMHQVVGEAIAEHNSHVCLALAEQAVHIVNARHAVVERHVRVGRQAVARLARKLVMRHVENRHAHVLHLRRYCIAEQQEQHHRHGEQYEHAAAVAQDVQKLFAYKRNVLLHASTPFRLACKTVKNIIQIVSNKTGLQSLGRVERGYATVYHD